MNDLNVNITSNCTFTSSGSMKNVTISLSEDLARVLDSLCQDCNLSRYAFAKEALIEKIERHAKNELKGETDRDDMEKASEENTEREDKWNPPWIDS